MRYISTRDDNVLRSFSDIALSGLASNRGLYMPESVYPYLDLERLRNGDRIDIPYAVMRPYVDLPDDVLIDIINTAYLPTLFPGGYARLEQITGTNYFLLLLSNGPTSAFKDYAMQLLALVFAYLVAQTGRQITIIVATSGDTGGAVIEAFANKKNIRAVVLFPDGRVSDFQRRQMTTNLAENVRAYAIRGTFDDCQAIAKALLSDVGFSERLGLTSANSINWTRILAQIAYWVNAWLQVPVSAGKPVFVIPTGNVGDGFSGYAATQMGADADIVMATNANDVVHRFVTTGIYEKGSVIETSSPSMNIQVASNLERLLFESFGSDPEKTAAFMRDFETTGRAVHPDMSFFAQNGIASGCASEEEVAGAMQHMLSKHGRLIDTHTGAGYAVALKKFGPQPDRPIILAETALPVKFGDDVYRFTGVRPQLSERQKAMIEAYERFEVLDPDTHVVKAAIEAWH